MGDLTFSKHILIRPSRALRRRRSPLEPLRNEPAQRRPQKAEHPAGDHVGRVVDPEVHAADAYEECQKIAIPMQYSFVMRRSASRISIAPSVSR